MPKITLGTANFHNYYGITKNKFAISEIRRKLPKILKENNINNFDTAIVSYFPMDFFKFLKLKNPKITTKIKLPNKNKAKFLKNLKMKICNQIEKLGINKFEAILVHDVKDLFSKYGKELKRILLELKIEKKTKMIGASLYSTDQIKKTMGFMKLDIIQFPLNIFNTSFVSLKWKKYYKKNSIKIQIRSIFLQGLLLQNEKVINNLHLNKELKLQLSKYNNWLGEKKLKKMNVNINFIKKYFSIIDYLVIGVDNYSQILQILKLLKSKKNQNLNIKNFSTSISKIIDPRKW